MSDETIIIEESSPVVLEILEGLPGMSGEKGEDGKVVEWQDEVEYSAEAMVYLDGNIYVALSDNQDESPVDNADVWQLISSGYLIPFGMNGQILTLISPYTLSMNQSAVYLGTLGDLGNSIRYAGDDYSTDGVILNGKQAVLLATGNASDSQDKVVARFEEAGPQAWKDSASALEPLAFVSDIPIPLQGNPGAAATVSVGTVTTGAPGSAASVTNSGTSTAAVLDISIPRGNQGVSGATGIPTGASLEFAGDTAPEGFLMEDGSAVSRTTYATLFGVIGTKYGNGDGSTTFNLPNRSGRVGVGKAGSGTFANLAATGGQENVALTSDQMPTHKHNLHWSGNTANGDDGYPAGGFKAVKATDRDGSSGSLAMENTGGGQPHSNLQPYIVMNYIIKT